MIDNFRPSTVKNIDQLDIRPAAGGVVLPVKVVPGARGDRIAGVLGEALKIATSAPPERGRANAAVAGMLAKALGIDRRSVELVSGRASRRKAFRVSGLTAGQVRRRLGG